MLQYYYTTQGKTMSFISFIIGVIVGAAAMKIYLESSKRACEEELKSEHLKNRIHEEEAAHSENIEITVDGHVEVDPTDEEIIISTVNALKKSNARVSLAAVSRESGLSNYKVKKHKALIDKLKSE